MSSPHVTMSDAKPYLDKKVLIFGGSSFVGGELFRRIGNNSIATFNSTSIPSGVKFDATTMSLADLVPDTHEFTDAVILIGDTEPDSCFKCQARSQLLNVDSIEKLIDQLIAANIRPVFTSSEFVFDGTKGEYTETDAAQPILIYGEQKLSVERYLQAATDDYAILRLAKVFGTTPGDGTLFSGMVEPIMTQSVIRCAADQRFSSVFVGDVVAAIVAAIEKPLNGVFHIAGPAGGTRLEFLQTLMAEVAKYTAVTAKSVACSIHDFGLPEDRPVDVSMSPSKYVNATGTTLMSAQEACEIICRKWFSR